MPIVRRLHPPGRFGRRHLDPTQPLYVLRRIAGAHDPATGVQSYARPGDVFDPTSVALLRLQTLYAGRYITHERPRTAAPLNPETPVTPPPPAIGEPKGKRPRAGA
jgi:hypothetical protein